MPERGAYEPPKEISWEDPAPREHKKGSKWDPIAKMLKEHPGKWACLGRNMPTSIVTTIRSGSLKCFQPAGSFEAATRNHTDRWVADVYVRYIGDE
jgi:hypothetical protein